MAKRKEPTATALVTDYLRLLNDFATCSEMAKVTGKTIHQVTSAVHLLKGYKVVDAVEVNGRLWWFALPPEQDTRLTTYDERTPESKPRKKKYVSIIKKDT